MTTPRRILPLAAIGGALLLLASAVTAADTVLHPFLVAQPKQAPQEVNLAYRFANSNGDIRLAGTAATDARGRLQIELPGALANDVARLELNPAGDFHTPEIRADLQPSGGPMATFLAS